MTPEQATLLLLCHLRLDAPSSLPQVGSAAEWQELLDCSLAQNLAPLLYFRLKQAPPQAPCPAEVFKALRQAYYGNAARNLKLSHELGVILDALAPSHIPVIVLKGAHLAASVYASPALRYMADLDILLPAADVTSALETLLAIGYRSLTPPWLAKAHHAALISVDGSLSLELHWRLDTGDTAFNQGLADIWADARPQTIAGQSVLVLSPEDLAIHLSQHAALHHLYAQGLRVLCDLDAIIRLPAGLDWDKLVSRAHRWRVDRAVALTLCLCQQYLGTPVPAPAAASLGLERLDAAILRGALRRLSSLDDPDRLASKFSMRFLSEKTPGRRLRLLLEFIREQVFPAAPPAPAQAGSSERKFDLRALLHLLGELPSILWRLLNRKPGIFQQFKQQKDLARWLNP